VLALGGLLMKSTYFVRILNGDYALRALDYRPMNLCIGLDNTANDTSFVKIVRTRAIGLHDGPKTVASLGHDTCNSCNSSVHDCYLGTL